MSRREFLRPDYHEINTTGVAPTIPLGVTATIPPSPYVDTSRSVYCEQVLRRTQQIVFLPHFVATDHIFHGDRIESNRPEDGWPTIRTAVVDGTNFHLYLHINYNSRDNGHGTTTKVSMKDEADGLVVIEAFDGMIDPESAEWLIESVLSPVQSELMALPVDEDDEY
ncbi:MAG TPA: hypothetical protein VIH90_08055 [Candidatus Saccharimonadales bacterium]